MTLGRPTNEQRAHLDAWVELCAEDFLLERRTYAIASQMYNELGELSEGCLCSASPMRLRLTAARLNVSWCGHWPPRPSPTQAVSHDSETWTRIIVATNTYLRRTGDTDPWRYPARVTSPFKCRRLSVYEVVESLRARGHRIAGEWRTPGIARIVEKLEKPSGN